MLRFKMRNHDICVTALFLFMMGIQEGFCQTVDSLIVQHVMIDNQHLTLADVEDMIVLYPVQKDWMGKEKTFIVDYDQELITSVEFNKVNVQKGSQIKISDISANYYQLSVLTNDGNTLNYKFGFTCLPICMLKGNFGYDYTQGEFLLKDPDDSEGGVVHMIKSRWRGSTGASNHISKHKRNYLVKFLDEEGGKKDVSFFSLRKDNTWILDAGNMDFSRIRNRVLTDLWNDFASKPYYYDKEPKALTGTRGKFVEVVLNNHYQGIYCLTENNDRKQMKLKKFKSQDDIKGLLYKSEGWTYETMMGTRPDNYGDQDSPTQYDNSSETWCQFEVKYPNLDDLESTDWSVLYNAVNFVSKSSDKEFKESINSYFDIPVLIDYYLLMEMSLSTDNHGKNLLWACYDKSISPMLTIGVWDMDATVGQYYNLALKHTEKVKPEQDYSQYITENEHGDFNLFRRMRVLNACDFNEKLQERYFSLRSSHFDIEKLNERFNTYFELFKMSGADKRECHKWSEDSDLKGQILDFDDERDYLNDWISRRMNYLDNYRFSKTNGINELFNYSLDIEVDGGAIYAKASCETFINILDMRGVNIKRIHLNKGLNNLGKYPKGCYIVGNRKVLIY